jgi:putative transposase
MVALGGDFETHRAAVEPVSVLFELYSGDAQGFIATGELGDPAPSGWTVTAARFEVEWPADPDRRRVIRSHLVRGGKHSIWVRRK